MPAETKKKNIISVNSSEKSSDCSPNQGTEKMNRIKRGEDDRGWNDDPEPSSQRASPRTQMSTSSHKNTSEWRLPGVPKQQRYRGARKDESL